MKYVYVFLASVILSFVNCFLRSGYVHIAHVSGFPLAILGFMIMFLVFTFIILKESKQSDVPKLVVVILLGSSILELFVYAIEFKFSLISFLDLPCRWLAIIVAYFCYRWHKCKFRLSFLLIPYLIFTFWLTFNGFDLWSHKLHFGTFTGNIIEDVSTKDILFTNEVGKQIQIDQLHGEYVFFDFWFTGCRVCYSEMPDLQKLYNSSNKNRIELYSVCCYNEKLGEDYLTGSNVLSEKGYNFPILSIDIKDSLLQSLGIKSMPIVLIFNSERKLVFRGSFEYAKDFIKDI